MDVDETSALEPSKRDISFSSKYLKSVVEAWGFDDDDDEGEGAVTRGGGRGTAVESAADVNARVFGTSGTAGASASFGSGNASGLAGTSGTVMGTVEKRARDAKLKREAELSKFDDGVDDNLDYLNADDEEDILKMKAGAKQPRRKQKQSHIDAAISAYVKAHGKQKLHPLALKAMRDQGMNIDDYGDPIVEAEAADVAKPADADEDMGEAIPAARKNPSKTKKTKKANARSSPVGKTSPKEKGKRKQPEEASAAEQQPPRKKRRRPKKRSKQKNRRKDNRLRDHRGNLI